jgi:tRNA (guanine26-N2/guanine27-N2)-dimethyltransferase
LRISETTEGGTRLFVPRASLENEVPPTAPVFFNPAASANRDVTVAITAAAGGATFCDSLAGVGARGVRVATEASREIEVTLVDFNRDALKVAEKSARANGVKGRCAIACEEARTFLHSRYGKGEKFDFVDVDPFGTPAPFLQALVSAASDGGVVSATATDTAALCGVYPSVSRRRYSAMPLNNHFHHETGARILLNAVRREAAILDRGIVPLAAHSTRHYIRVYARVEDGAAKADAALGNEGYVSVCSKCHDVASPGAPPKACEKCGGKVRWAGPLWVGAVTDKRVVARSAEAARKGGLGEASRILAGLEGVDAFPPWGFSIDGICSLLGVATVPETRVRKLLAEIGFASGRQPFEKTGLKTTAPYASVFEAVRRASPRG